MNQVKALSRCGFPHRLRAGNAQEYDMLQQITDEEKSWI
jgi:hypothetical protein